MNSVAGEAYDSPKTDPAFISSRIAYLHAAHSFQWPELGGRAKQESRYPLVTCEELKKLIDSKATQDIVIVDTQPREYFD